MHNAQCTCTVAAADHYSTVHVLVTHVSRNRNSCTVHSLRVAQLWNRVIHRFSGDWREREVHRRRDARRLVAFCFCFCFVLCVGAPPEPEALRSRAKLNAFRMPMPTRLVSVQYCSFTFPVNARARRGSARRFFSACNSGLPAPSNTQSALRWRWHYRVFTIHANEMRSSRTLSVSCCHTASQAFHFKSDTLTHFELVSQHCSRHATRVV